MRLAILVIIVQAVALAFFVLVSVGLGAGWYISYQSWQDYIQPREEAFYDGVFYVCRFMGGLEQTCQELTESFYSVEAFHKRYSRGSQDWAKTQSREAGEVR